MVTPETEALNGSCVKSVVFSSQRVVTVDLGLSEINATLLGVEGGWYLVTCIGSAECVSLRRSILHSA